MATSDLIAFVRARIDDMDTGKRVPGVVDHLAGAMRKIVDEYASNADSNPGHERWDAGYEAGLEHAVVALAGMWRGHSDWREGWW